MSLPSTLRIDHLRLRNFRCFAECEIHFHSSLTVLVASNGSGKTALLDAVSTALAPFVDAISGLKQYGKGFWPTDARRLRWHDHTMGTTTMVLARSTELEAHGSADEKRVNWKLSRNNLLARPRSPASEVKPLVDLALNLRHRLEDFATRERELPPPLPLVAFYGTGRLWSEHRLTQAKRSHDPSVLGRVSGYLDCLSPSSSFKAFVDWYEHTTQLAQSTPVGAGRRPDRPENLLNAVRTAVQKVLAPTGWNSLHWDLKHDRLLADHPTHGTLPLSFLSDGVRNMIALVADITHRCIRLNPHFGAEAARLTPGVLLIDEIDMHLHPEWQQQVIGLLSEAFPAMQMIFTTHSPQVLSTVNADSIRLVKLVDDKGTLDTPQFQTRGVQSADVLAAIMGVDPVPQVPEARMLSRYRALIEDGQVDSRDALDLRAKLLDHFGPQHPVMIDCDRLIRFQAFRLKASARREG